MKLLFITSGETDYMGDSLLHGLRSVLGNEVVDYPKADRLYRTISAETRHGLYGHGFSLYGLLSDEPIDRTDIVAKVRHSYFDGVIFGSIWRTWEEWRTLYPFLNARKCAIVDGEDVENLFPYSRSYLLGEKRLFIPRALKCSYFKRELTRKSIRSRWYFLLPNSCSAAVPFPKKIIPTSFSIPEEKILVSEPTKTKDFPRHIVDGELAKELGIAEQRYVFQSESDYYRDLQHSRFGITTKRAGWDCLRHYEIAANGAVLCFRSLQLKEQTCAPHGLNSSNCIAYDTHQNLMRTIDRLSPDQYNELRQNTLLWARENTTVRRAKEALRALRLAS